MSAMTSAALLPGERRAAPRCGPPTSVATFRATLKKGSADAIVFSMGTTVNAEPAPKPAAVIPGGEAAISGKRLHVLVDLTLP